MTLPVHAAEVIYDKKEGWFISNTGWDKKDCTSHL